MRKTQLQRTDVSSGPTQISSGTAEAILGKGDMQVGGMLPVGGLDQKAFTDFLDMPSGISDRPLEGKSKGGRRKTHAMSISNDELSAPSVVTGNSTSAQEEASSTPALPTPMDDARAQIKLLAKQQGLASQYAMELEGLACYPELVAQLHSLASGISTVHKSLHSLIKEGACDEALKVASG